MHYLTSIAPSTLVFATLMMGFITVRFIWPSQIPKLLGFVESRKFWLPVCDVLLVGYMLLLALSTTYLGFNDHVEPNIVTVSSLVSRGEPLHHGLESAQRYALLYGPMSYLPFVWSLRFFGQRVLSVKLVVMFANLGVLALLWRTYRTRLTWQQTVLATVAVVSFLLAGEPYLIEVRGDVLIIMAAAIGLGGALSASPWKAGLFLAVGTGLCVGAKITGFLYSVPLFVLVYRRYGARITGTTLLGAAAIACLPFTLPEVSVTNYLLWLREAGRHPLAWRYFIKNVKILMTVSIPLMVLLWRLYERNRQGWFVYLRQEKVFLLSLIFSVGLMTVAASKGGSGPHHYLPFYPLLGYMCCDIYSRAKTVDGIRLNSMRVTVCVACSLWLLTRVATLIAWGWTFTAPHVWAGRDMAASVTNDLQEIMRGHSMEKIEMGYGDNLGRTSEVTYLRPVLVFAGNPLTLDEAALDDMELSKLTMPQSTISYMESCRTQIWLIPKNQHPFILPSYYDDLNIVPAQDIFGNAFRQAFFSHYQKRESSIYFDLWSCHGKEPAG